MSKRATLTSTEDLLRTSKPEIRKAVNPEIQPAVANPDERIKVTFTIPRAIHIKLQREKVSRTAAGEKVTVGELIERAVEKTYR